MTDERPSEVLGSLPRTRPHRRSQKRATRAADDQPTAANGAKAPSGASAAKRSAAPKAGRSKAPKRPRATGAKKATEPAAITTKRKTERLSQPAQPAGTPAGPRSRKPVPASGTEIIGTAIQAAAELAEIGLSMSARAIRGAVSRLPRP